MKILSVLGVFLLCLSGNTFAQIAFFYQTVGPFVSGSGHNTVEIGTSQDGLHIRSNDVSALSFYVGPSEDSTYGDPVFSYLPNGNWSMTAWSGPTDPRGSGKMLYYESACPVVDPAAVIALGPDTVTLHCLHVGSVQIGKTSQAFAVNGKTYVLHSNSLGVHIACMNDGVHSATELTHLCIRDTPYTTLAQLNHGESMRIYHSDSLFLSDCAIAKRTDGTFVIFLKGINSSSAPASGSIAELAARGIYRITTTDFINFTPIEKIVSKASVPEATTAPDGKVWLYWQDFTDACAANNLALAAVAPISSAYETPSTHVLSTPQEVYFNDEAFQTNASLHYATNGNPILLPDQAAWDNLHNCVTTHGGTWNTAGLTETPTPHTVRIFPNPATDVITVELPENTSFRLRILSAAGSVIKEISYGKGTIEIPVSELAHGLYLIEVTTTQKREIQRLELH